MGSVEHRHEVLVVGAGPAGLHAALAAAEAGCSVGVLDAAARPGGQYWRHLPPERGLDPAPLHHDFARARDVLARLQREPLITSYVSSPVWHAQLSDSEGWVVLDVVRDGREERLQAPAAVIATGASDRALPFPGWDLPGVLTPGGAQALLKGEYVLPGQRIVVAGTGPFLLPVAAGLAEAGAEVVAVCEANHPWRWLRHLGAGGENLGKLVEARDYARVLRKHRVPLRLGWQVRAAEGHEEVRSAVLARGGRRPRIERVAVDTVCVGFGFVPHLELAMALGCATALEPLDGSVVAVAGSDQASSVPGVFLAGEVCGVGGAELAATEGTIAGRAAARFVGRAGALHGARAERRLRRRRARGRRFAQALLATYPVPTAWASGLPDDIVVCRCEEVTAGRVRDAVRELGATDLRSVKLLARPGMGLCQGRICGPGVAGLLAAETGHPGTDAAGAAARPVAVPVRLGSLADTDRRG